MPRSTSKWIIKGYPTETNRKMTLLYLYQNTAAGIKENKGEIPGETKDLHGIAFQAFEPTGVMTWSVTFRSTEADLFKAMTDNPHPEVNNDLLLYLLFLARSKYKTGSHTLRNARNFSENVLAKVSASKMLFSELRAYYHNQYDTEKRSIGEKLGLNDNSKWNQLEILPEVLSPQLIDELTPNISDKPQTPAQYVDKFCSALEHLWTKAGIESLSNRYQSSFDRTKSLTDTDENQKTKLEAGNLHLYAGLYKRLQLLQNETLAFEVQMHKRYQLPISSEESHLYVSSIHMGLSLGGTLNQKELDFLIGLDLAKQSHPDTTHLHLWQPVTETAFEANLKNNTLRTHREPNKTYQPSIPSIGIALNQADFATDADRKLALSFEEACISEAQIANQTYAQQHGEFTLRKLPHFLKRIYKCNHLRVNIQPHGIWCSIILSINPLNLLLGFWTPHKHQDTFFTMVPPDYRYELVQICAGIWRDAHVVEEIKRTITRGYTPHPNNPYITEPDKSTIYLPRRIYNLNWGTETERIQIQHTLDSVSRIPHNRRPHYRRLPDGWTKSEDADRRATEAGFAPAPPNHTFVKGSTITGDNSAKPEIICRGLLRAAIGISGLMSDQN